MAPSKAVSFFAAVALTASLAGCGSGSGGTPAPSVSRFIPLTMASFEGVEADKYRLYVSNGGGPAHPVVLDTGSQLMVIPIQYVGSRATPVTPTQCHAISYADKTTWCGRFYSGPVALGVPSDHVPGQGSYPTTSSTFPFLVVDPADSECIEQLKGQGFDCAKMPSDLTNRGLMGVGFGKGTLGTAYNALLQLQEVAAGTMAPGYIVQLGRAEPGVTAGLTAENTSGFGTIQLTMGSTGQWNANSFTSCVTLSTGGTRAFDRCANGVFDTGTVNLALETPKALKPASVMGFDASATTTVPDRGPINSGTTVSITAPAISPVVSLTYLATPTTTWASTQSSASWSEAKTGDASFYLIGQFIFMNYDYMFDPTAGRIGFKAAPKALPPQIVPANTLGPLGTAIVADRTPVALVTPTPGVDIYYTTDGSAPSPTHGTKYTVPVVLTATPTTIKAVAVVSGFQTSEVASMAYTVYASPYDITPIFTEAQLGSDFPVRDAILPSTVPQSNWYNLAASYYTEHPGERTWGPLMDVGFPADTVPPTSSQTLEWKRQRILYSARRHLDTQYQHHHLLEWAPPEDWPFYPISLGHQSTGIDCSSFTAWNYNYALGITMTEDVADQAALTSVTGPDGESIPVIRVDKQGTFAETVASFRKGDLLYIKGSGSSSAVTHAITWIGQVGGTGEYLIIDSRDQLETRDVVGDMIPTGVQIRPFTATSWYYQSLSHANRILY